MLKIYNTLTHKKEIFKPIIPGFVKMYVCGITVYDYCHIGHARIIVNFDMIARWLRFKGMKVSYVRNITDIDDKIINRCIEKKIPIDLFTNFYINAMHFDEKSLNVYPPNLEPKATEHIESMLSIIDHLQKNGFAYIAKNGDVNFSVRKFANYGKLSGKTIDKLKSNNRNITDIYKNDPLDFALWKSSKDSDPKDSKWNSVYGLGRPGWHIECSAMSYKTLGLPLDIHGGGPDLKFPHHENEIAQSEGAFKKKLSNIWMHCGPLMMDSEKMSKSLGNFRTIRETIGYGDLSKINYSVNNREAEMLRFFILKNHYRSTQFYSLDNLIDAQNSLDRLYRVLNNMNDIILQDIDINWQNIFVKRFIDAMDDDFNTPLAISILFELGSIVNRTNSISDLAIFKKLAEMLGLLQQDPNDYFKLSTRYNIYNNKNSLVISNEEVDHLVQQRLIAKKNNNYYEADKIRNKLMLAGVLLEDKCDGNTVWRRT